MRILRCFLPHIYIALISFLRVIVTFPVILVCHKGEVPLILFQTQKMKLSYPYQTSGFKINGCPVVPDNQNYNGATKLCWVVAPWATQSVMALVPNEDLIDLNKYNSLLSLESKRYLKVSGKKKKNREILEYHVHYHWKAHLSSSFCTTYLFQWACCALTSGWYQ